MIETHVAGRPSDLRAAAAYLTDVLAEGVAALADTAAGQRLDLEAGWLGASGDAFVERATVLARAADELHDVITAAGAQVGALAATLEEVLAVMADVRGVALVSGLTVAGTAVQPPPPAHPGAPTYLALESRVAAARARWESAVAAANAFTEDNATNLAQAASTLLVTAYTSDLKARLRSVMAAQAAFKKAESTRLLGTADDLVDHVRSGRLTPPTDFYEHYDDLMSRGHQAADDAKGAAALADDVRLPAGLARGLASVGPVAAAYGVYDDIRHGESIEQAVYSQGGGLAAGIVAGGSAAIACTPVAPGIGTVACGVTFGLLGAAAGWGANDIVDRTMESDARSKAEEGRRRDAERVRQLINLEQGLPLYSTPGSDALATFPGRD